MENHANCYFDLHTDFYFQYGDIKQNPICQKNLPAKGVVSPPWSNPLTETQLCCGKFKFWAEFRKQGISNSNTSDLLISIWFSKYWSRLIWYIYGISKTFKFLKKIFTTILENQKCWNFDPNWILKYPNLHNTLVFYPKTNQHQFGLKNSLNTLKN